MCVWTFEVWLAGVLPSGWGGNSEGTDVYSVGSALNKSQQDMWCVPTGRLCWVESIWACVEVWTCEQINNDLPQELNIMHIVERWRRDFGWKARKISENNADRARRHLHQSFTHLDKSSGKNKQKLAGWNQIQTFLSVLLQNLFSASKTQLLK